ncbi:MAG: TlpA family protein disulfide reductase [Planctomycetaceae bacterium]|nr:TlpA family protein disulfide reductase [Planctomycetaceae bacterium]
MFFSISDANEVVRDISSLDSANTIAEVFAYVDYAKKQAAKEDFDDKINNKQSQILRKLGKAYLAAAEKIIKIANDKSEQDKGIKLKFAGLKILIRADDLDGITIETQVSEFQLAFYKLLDELEKEGRLPIEVSNELLVKLIHYDSFVLDKEKTIAKFDEFVQKAKKLSTKNNAGYKSHEPLDVVLSIAKTTEWSTLYPQLYKKTINDLINFVKSNEFNLPENDKKTTLDFLNGYASRIVGVVPEIVGKTVDNNDFDLNALRGKYVLVTFTATWCSPCRKDIPLIADDYKKYREKGLEIVSIYVNDKLKDVKKLVEQEKIDWVVISDELTIEAGKKSLMKKFSISNLAETFIVDRNGKIIVTEIHGKAISKKIAELFQTDKE